MKKLLPLVLLLAAAGCTNDLVCPRGQTDCGGRCVSLLSDEANCGACGNACGALEACGGGTCGCAPGVETCGGACTDLTRDPANCGGCGVACGGATAFCLAGPEAACTDTCPAERRSCGGACVDVASDRLHCGECGRTCGEGETCREGACRSDLQVACFNTMEVIPATAELAAGASRAVPGGPIALAVTGSAVYSANNWPAAGVSVLPLDAALPAKTTPIEAQNEDVQSILAAGGLLVVTNADAGTLVFLDPQGAVVDELALSEQDSFPNPKEVAIVGDMAYVALSGSGPTNGQRIAKVDVSGLATCRETGVCGVLAGEIDVLAIAGTSDDPGLPFPARALAVNGRVYVTLTNIAEDCTDFGCFYAKPAGSGKVLVIDPARDDATTVVDLGEGCANPSGLAASGSTLWVTCGAVFYADLAPGAMVAIDLTRSPPVPSDPIALAPFVPGKVAFCGGVGYVGDQGTGDVRRFDPAARTFEDPVPICPEGPYGFTTVSDVACAP